MYHWSVAKKVKLGKRVKPLLEDWLYGHVGVWYFNHHGR